MGWGFEFQGYVSPIESQYISYTILIIVIRPLNIPYITLGKGRVGSWESILLQRPALGAPGLEG